MIGQTLILADESASFRIGGLTQLERLLLSIDVFLREAPQGAFPGGPIVVCWKRGSFDGAAADAALGRGIPFAQLRPDGDRAGGTVQKIPSPPDGSSRLLVHTAFLPGRGALEYLLGTAVAAGQHPPALPLTVLSGPFPTGEDETWESLADLLPARNSADGAAAPAFVDSSQPVFYAVVEGPDDIDRQERRLFRSLGKESDGFSAKRFNRLVSTRVSRLLSRTAVTPNQVSFALIALVFAGAWCLARGTGLFFFLGVLIYDIVSILDGCDGEIARVKFLESNAGSWIDTLADMFGHHLFIFALGLGLSRQAGLGKGMSNFYFLEGVLTAAFMALTLFGIARLERKRTCDGTLSDFGPSVIRSSPLTGVFRSLAVLVSQICRRDTYNHLFVLAAAAGQAALILHLFAIAIVGHMAALLYAIRTAPQRGGR